MPTHDWGRVPAGIFHDFHHDWITEIKRALNDGRLPPDYYALAEQTTGSFGPDVLTLQQNATNGNGSPTNGTAGPNGGSGGTAVALAPPRVSFTATTEMAYYVRKQKGVVIHHSSDDRVVAIIEIVSPGNKASEYALQKFVEKVAEALDHGIHLLILDLHAPTTRDPQGIHGAIWARIEADNYQAPTDKPLTLAAYAAGDVVKTAYVEPVTVGMALPEMPLFLMPEGHIKVPLEATYQAAWKGVPRRWQRVLETEA